MPLHTDLPTPYEYGVGREFRAYSLTTILHVAVDEAQGAAPSIFRVRTSIRFDPRQVADWLEMKMPAHSVRTQRQSESAARA